MIGFHACGAEILLSPSQRILSYSFRNTPWDTIPEHPLVPTWNQALSLSIGDFLFMPSCKERCNFNFRSAKITIGNDTRALSINRDTAWFLGLYASTGSTGGRDRLTIQAPLDRRATAKMLKQALKSIDKEVKLKQIGWSSFYEIRSAWISESIRKWSPQEPSGRDMPSFILSHEDPEIPKAFILGLLHGSTASEPYSAGCIMTTTSKKMAISVMQTLCRLGIRFSGRPHVSNPESIAHDLTIIEWDWDNKKRRHGQSLPAHGLEGAFLPIESILNVYPRTIYHKAKSPLAKDVNANGFLIKLDPTP